MVEHLDISGILITHLGDRIPCKITDINERGYLKIFSLDPVEVNSRLQLLTGTPRIKTAIKVTSSEHSGDVYVIEALPELPVEEIKKLIISNKIRNIINRE